MIQQTDCSTMRNTVRTVLACPCCRRPIPISPTATQCSCGQPIEHDEHIWNFLDTDSAKLTSTQCAAIAHWLVDHGSKLLSLQESAAHSLDQYVGRHLPAEIPFETFQVARNRLPFVQVLNDLADHAGERAEDRDADMRRFVGAHLNLSPGDVLLDAGCSTGRNFSEVPQGVTCVGVDLTPEALYVGAAVKDTAFRGKTTILCAADILKLPVADEACSHVQSYVVLGLVPMERALAEISRVLREEGRIALTIEGTGFWQECWDTAPAWSFQRLALCRWNAGRWLRQAGVRWQEHRHLKRLAGLMQYTPQSLRKALERAGFHVEAITVLREYRGKPRLIGASAVKRR